jgi:predicted RNase H-like nuclease (RuvC/YqgF family)
MIGKVIYLVFLFVLIINIFCLELNRLQIALQSYLDGLPEAVESTNADRATLVQRTKEFRALSDQNDRLKQLPSLIKRYQQHIDVIKRRAEAAETNLSSLDALTKLPDPSDQISSSQQQIQLLEEKIESLQQSADDVSTLRAEIENLQQLLQQSKTNENQLLQSNQSFKNEIEQFKTGLFCCIGVVVYVVKCLLNVLISFL